MLFQLGKAIYDKLAANIYVLLVVVVARYKRYDTICDALELCYLINSQY